MVYVLVICAVILFSTFGIIFHVSGFGSGGVVALVLALLGGIGAILLMKGNSAGWGICMVWSAVQIVPVIVHGHFLNRQVLHVGIISTTSGSGLGLNIVGIVLLSLFVVAKRQSTGVPRVKGFAETGPRVK